MTVQNMMPKATLFGMNKLVLRMNKPWSLLPREAQS